MVTTVEILGCVNLYFLFNLRIILRPAALPITPPIIPLIICPAVEFPNAVLTPAATQALDPTLALKIDSPALI